VAKSKGGLPTGAALFLCALAIGGLAGAFALERLRRRLFSVAVAGESMAPTLNDGDWLIVDRNLDPRPGDVVLLMDPRDHTRELIKRVHDIDASHGIWVEGDNPAASTDSRTFGRVDSARILGRVVARYWPGWPRRIAARSRASSSNTSSSVGNASGGGSAGAT
jgi:nickel-type superoxide dismutase maturation protease